MFTRRTLIGLVGAATILGTAGAARAEDKLYIALISKGFQHQFWQAVKLGSEQAAKDRANARAYLNRRTFAPQRNAAGKRDGRAEELA